MKNFIFMLAAIKVALKRKYLFVEQYKLFHVNLET